MGRRKLEIKPITDKVSRQVTFSKRKAGLFKKANELVTLCSSEVCIIVFSPGGRCFYYASPDAESIISRYLNEGQGDEEIREVSNNDESGLKDEIAETLGQLKLEKQKGKRHKRGDDNIGRAKKARVDEIETEMEELEEIKRSMDKLKVEVKRRIKEIETEMEVCSALLLLADSGGSKGKELMIE